MKTLIENVKKLNYSPYFKVTYQKNVDKNTFTTPEITFGVRKEEEDMFVDIIIVLSTLSNAKVGFVDPFIIPSS